MSADRVATALAERTLLLDGSTGTQLMDRGLPSGHCAELWNVERPTDVEDIARTYFAAGSDAVLTNTFCGSAIQLAAHGIDNRTYDLNRAGAECAVAVRPEGKFVFASIGPTGVFMTPVGPHTEADITAAYADQVSGVRDAGVDAIVLETFTDLQEITCAIRVVREETDLPYICSMTFDKSPRGYHTMMGVSIAQAADALTAAGALAVGSNCGNGFANMCEIAAEFRACSAGLRILAKPNAGMPELRDGQTVYTETPEDFAAQAPALLATHPALIGGCCGTTADHVRALHAVLDAA